MYFSNVRVYLYLHVTSIFLLDHFLLYDVVHVADPLARHPHLFLQDDLLLDGTLQDSNTRHNASVTEHWMMLQANTVYMIHVFVFYVTHRVLITSHGIPHTEYWAYHMGYLFKFVCTSLYAVYDMIHLFVFCAFWDPSGDFACCSLSRRSPLHRQPSRRPVAHVPGDATRARDPHSHLRLP